jgi:hypothetical protein
MAYRSWAAIAALLVLAWARELRAQPCCTGATTIGTARLASFETALIGFALRLDVKTGDFNSGAEYSSARNDRHRGLKEDLLLGVRIVKGLQAGASLSFLQTWRSSRDDADFGGGLGDLGLSLRYDILEPGEHDFIPGIAISAGTSIPTGKPIEESTHHLAADATTSGFVQGALALSVSDTFFEEQLVVETVAAYTHWFPRRVEELSVARGEQVTISLGASWVIARDLSLGALAAFDFQGGIEVDGVGSPGSSRRSTTLALVAALRVESVRLQASLFDTLPIDELGKNEPAMLGIRLAVIGTVL